MKLGEAMYKTHEPQQAANDTPAGENPGTASASGKKAEDRYADAVDAEYEPVNKKP